MRTRLLTLALTMLFAGSAQADVVFATHFDANTGSNTILTDDRWDQCPAGWHRAYGYTNNKPFEACWQYDSDVKAIRLLTLPKYTTVVKPVGDFYKVP